MLHYHIQYLKTKNKHAQRAKDDDMVVHHKRRRVQDFTSLGLDSHAVETYVTDGCLDEWPVNGDTHQKGQFDFLFTTGANISPSWLEISCG